MPQNEYIEQAIKRHGHRLDHFEKRWGRDCIKINVNVYKTAIDPSVQYMQYPISFKILSISDVRKYPENLTQELSMSESCMVSSKYLRLHTVLTVI